MRAGFVSFNSRWGAAVCAQTQQSKDHTKWLTEWAPEPRDVYWNNLALPYMMLNFRRLIISLVVFALVFFYFIPVAFVQSLANLDSLNKWFPFLKPVTKLWVLLHTPFLMFYLCLCFSQMFGWTEVVFLEHQSTLLFQHVDHAVGDQTVFVTNFCVFLLQEVCDIIYTRVSTRTTYEGIPGYPSLSVDGPY